MTANTDYDSLSTHLEAYNNWLLNAREMIDGYAPLDHAKFAPTAEVRHLFGAVQSRQLPKIAHEILDGILADNSANTLGVTLNTLQQSASMETFTPTVIQDLHLLLEALDKAVSVLWHRTMRKNKP